MSASRELLALARAGDSAALSALFHRHGDALRRWARGRLPTWARTINDTADLVQDTLLQVFRRIDKFDDRGKGALQAYLRRAITSMVCDEIRRVDRRPRAIVQELALGIPSQSPSPFDLASDSDQERRYKCALRGLTGLEQALVVGRIELGYTYEQLALATNRPSAEAARLAVRRAMIKLAQRMANV